MKIGATGPGGLPSVLAAMINSKTPMELTYVPYDGDGPALTGLQGGTMQPRAVFDVAGVPPLPEVCAIPDSHPEFAEMPR